MIQARPAAGITGSLVKRAIANDPQWDNLNQYAQNQGQLYNMTLSATTAGTSFNAAALTAG